MFITVSQSLLAKALGVVGRVVAPRSSLPVTGHILLETRPGRLRLAATNLDLAIVTLIDAEVTTEGGLTAPARVLTDLVSSLPDGRVELARPAKAPDLRVRAAHAEATVKGLEASEFPAIEAKEPVVRYRVHAEALRQAIDDVISAVARDQTRPQLSGLLLRAREATLTLVGCDGFRVAIRRLPLLAPIADDCPDLIVPRAAMAEVARGFGALDEPVVIASTPTGAQALFGAATLQMITRIIDGSYVDFERVLAQTATHDVAISAAAAELARAARFSAIVARDASNALHLDARPGKDGALVFRAVAAQVGENTVEVAAAVDGPPAKLGLDSTYLADVLDAIHTERMTIKAASGATRPVLLTPEPDGDASFLIMPIHLR